MNADASGVGISLRLKKEGFFQQIEQMDLTYVTLIILASMIFVLSAMVGYLYWQQTRMMQQLNSISFAVSSHLASIAPPELPEPESEQEVEVPEAEEEVELPEEDDRASVTNEQVEIVSAPPEPEADIDDIQSKTTKQLQELLTKKGIPYGKRESKTTLIELLKATA